METLKKLSATGTARGVGVPEGGEAGCLMRWRRGEMTLAGFAAFLDPPRRDCRGSRSAEEERRFRVIMTATTNT